jgi:hypothetical protein
MHPFDMTTTELLASVFAAVAASALALIEARRTREDAAHRERTAVLEVRLELLATRVDEIDTWIEADDEEPEPPKPTARRARP